MPIRRTNRFCLLSALLITMTGFACSNSSSTAPPPVNDSGAGSDATTKDGAVKDGSADSAKKRPISMLNDGATSVPCASLPGTKIYIESGDTQEPILDAVGRELRDSANITILFLLTGSCTIVPEIYAGTPLPKNTDMLYIPSTAENPSWTTADSEYTCTTSTTEATPVDLGISALFPSSCGGTAPAGIGTFIGPIQAYTFVVPYAEFANGQTSISAEEAYYAFGDGAMNPVTWNTNPEWNMPSQFFLRPATKSTLVSTALNIGLTPAQMTLALTDGGTSDGRQLLASSTDVVSAAAAAQADTQAIGILGSEVYDANREQLINVLAFAGFGQTTRYFPDSTITSFDKENLRNGNYSLWSPAVLLAPIKGSGDAGVPSNPTVKYFIDIFLGNPGAKPPGGYIDGGLPIDGLGATVAAGLTPDCAMQVQRTADGAPLTSYMPSAPCTCYFLSKVPNAAALPASCVTCTDSSSCPSGSVGCFNGYCETWPPPSVPPAAVTKTGLLFPSADGGDGGLLPPNP